MEPIRLNTIEEAIADFKEGNFVIVVDDEDRENEGDFIIATENITSHTRRVHTYQNRFVFVPRSFY
jgi:3,4-dihydroxy-2-butanone 4-phosphate synthase